MKGYISLFAATLAQICGLLLTKLATVDTHGLSIQPIKELFSILLSPYTVMGVVCYCISLIFWLAAISILELSIAYPVASSVGYVLVALFSHYAFRETLSPLRIIGIAVITIGVILISLSRLDTPS